MRVGIGVGIDISDDLALSDFQSLVTCRTDPLIGRADVTKRISLRDFGRRVSGTVVDDDHFIVRILKLLQ